MLLFSQIQSLRSRSPVVKTTAYLAKYRIASFIKSELSRSVQDKQYVLMFDESMNKTTRRKQMDIHVRYWTKDDTDSHVISRYYGSQFMGHSRAEDMLDHFNVSIPWALTFAQKSYSKFVCLLIELFKYIRIFINNTLTIKFVGKT